MAREYIDREAALKRSCLMMIGNYIGEFVDVADIKKIPSADVVEVVRCKDCVSYLSPEEKPEYRTNDYGYCKFHVMDTEQHDFCSYGERRET